MNNGDALKVLVQALLYLVYGGAVVVAGKLYSRLLETIPGWSKIPSWAKEYIVLAIALAIALGAAVLLNLPPETLENIKVYLIAVGMTLLTWYSSQKEYERMKSVERMKRMMRDDQ